MNKIVAYCPLRHGRIIETEEGIRVTVESVDGRHMSADGAWLPRSAAQSLRIVKEEEHGIASYKLTAEVPEWWIAKLDTRAGWQKQGRSGPPMATWPV